MDLNTTFVSTLVPTDDLDHINGTVAPSKTPPSWALTLTASIALTISIVGFVGNILTIFALPHMRKLRNASTWFVVNLAVIEMCFCLTILPMSAAHLLHLRETGERLFNEKMCKIFVFLRFVVILAEVLSIAGIALNRCVLIAIPERYPVIFSPTKTFCFIIGIWAISVFVMTCPLMEIYGAFNYNTDTNECDFENDAVQERKVYLAVGFFIPCLIIVLSYSYIFYKSRQSAKRMRERKQPDLNLPNNIHASQASGLGSRPATGLRNRDLRVARTIAVIFLVFLVCCTPVTIAHAYGSEGQIPLLLLLLHPLYWLQYCLNSFIYVFMNKQYRNAYISYISKWWPKFKTITQQCFQPEEDEISTSQPLTSPVTKALQKFPFPLRKNRKTSAEEGPAAVPSAAIDPKYICWNTSCVGRRAGDGGRAAGGRVNLGCVTPM